MVDALLLPPDIHDIVVNVHTQNDTRVEVNQRFSPSKHSWAVASKEVPVYPHYTAFPEMIKSSDMVQSLAKIPLNVDIVEYWYLCQAYKE